MILKNSGWNVFVAMMCFIFITKDITAQPFIDPVNFNVQVFSGLARDSTFRKSSVLRTDYNLNVFVPKKFVNGNTFLFRLGYENLHSDYGENYANLYALSAPIGFQFLSKNKKWKTLVMGIPKIASDLKDNLSNDIQYGGTVLFTYVKNDSLLKLKFGLYYNRECFGNFFVPLIGIDWKATNKLSVYGILPNNMRIEYKAWNRFYFGLAYKNFQRSYRLSGDSGNDFVRIREGQVKLFADYFLWKNILLFADLAYSLKYDFAQTDNSDKETVRVTDAVYSPTNNNFLFTIGLAYRLRLD